MLNVENSKVSHPEEHWVISRIHYVCNWILLYKKARYFGWIEGSKMKFKPRFNILSSHVFCRLCTSPDDLFSDHVATPRKSLTRFQPPLIQLRSTLSMLHYECNGNFLHNIVNYSRLYLVGLSWVSSLVSISVKHSQCYVMKIWKYSP